MYAPEFPQNLKWINSEPLTIAELRGKAVLIDFWTYSCVNCIRTLPFLNAWHKKYSPSGLVIVGVHTPEFDFEKNYNNVERAVNGFKINYPVALDPDYKVWNLYDNHWWPRKFLIDAEGRIVYDHVGEGGYQETEKKIQEVLSGIDRGFKPPDLEKESGGRNMVCHPTTPEYYLGYERGSYGNAEDIHDGESFLYSDSTPHKVNRAYLKGQWLVASQYAEHASESPDFSDCISLNFEAAEVNVVAQSRDGDEIPAKIYFNGEAISKEYAGEDVKLENGETTVVFSAPRMYRLFDSKLHATGEIKIAVEKPGLQLFAFTFGGCIESL